jgi:hypothetical protein
MNQDVLRLIYSNLNPVQQLECHHVFQDAPPSQFTVSKELLSRYDTIKGIDGLVQMALYSGEYEPCVAAMLHYAHIRGLYSPDYESLVRSEFHDYDPGQRSDRLHYFIRFPSLFAL